MTGSPPQPPLRWYVALSVMTPLAVGALCVAALRLGRSRADDKMTYFYEVFDVGHPGIVNAVASMGFVCTAAIALVIAAVTHDRAWTVVGVLFVVVSGDNLLRLHNQVPAGDVLVRVVYWATLAWVVIRLRSTLAGVRGLAMLFIGITSFILSELFDLISSAPDGRLAVLEESFSCLGAWCLAVGAVGFASELLADARPVNARR